MRQRAKALDDRLGQRAANTGVAAVVVVQPVRPDEQLVRIARPLPVVHQALAAEQACPGLRRRGRQSLLKPRVARVIEDLGGALVVHQDDVDLGALQAPDAGLDEVLEYLGVRMAQHAVGADLPDDERRAHRERVPIDARDLLGRVLPADAAVDNGNVREGEMLAQLHLHHRRVAVGTIRGEMALRGRRAERYDDRVLISF